MENQEQQKGKVSIGGIVLLVIGAILSIVAIIVFISGSASFNSKMDRYRDELVEYEEDYKQWNEDFFNNKNPGLRPTKPEEPSRIGYIFAGGALITFGIVFMVAGGSWMYASTHNVDDEEVDEDEEYLQDYYSDEDGYADFISKKSTRKTKSTAKDTVKCPNCSASIPANSDSCPYCGSPRN